MSKRGVKFQFRSGESVLCFEPDASKAKVLYDAKILDVSVTHDKMGKRRPAYLIHFLRWNSSWDRVVPESYLLRNTDDNRALMRKLAVVSQKIKRNKMRMRKIDSVLKHHFHKTANPDMPIEFLESDIDEDTSTRDDTGTSESSDSLRDSETDARLDEDIESNKAATDDDDDDEDNDNDDARSTDQETEEDINQPREPIKLELPHTLKKILQRDHYLVRVKNNLLNLPAKLNVIGVLEGYVNFRSANAIPALAERQVQMIRSHDDINLSLIDNNIQLCKEVVDGLRVIFDFTLSLVLLYDCERDQYNSLLQCRLRQPLANSPSKLSVEGKRASRSLSPRASGEFQYADIKSEDETEIVFKNDSFNKQSKSYSPRQRRKAKAADTMTAAAGPETGPKRLRRSSRELSRHSDKDVHFAESTAAKLVFGSPSSSRASSPDRPPPKLTCSIAKESEPIEASEWKLIPEDMYYQVPAPPSLIYGAHHLLRLFVRLPSVLDQMFIPRSKITYLVRHLELFIQYLHDHRDELFPESAYSSDVQ